MKRETLPILSLRVRVNPKVLRWIQRRFLPTLKDASDEAIAEYYCEKAFCCPEAIGWAIECFVRYRDAEGLTGNNAVVALLNSAGARVSGKRLWIAGRGT